jgi:hypothetical protein
MKTHHKARKRKPVASAPDQHPAFELAERLSQVLIMMNDANLATDAGAKYRSYVHPLGSTNSSTVDAVLVPGSIVIGILVLEEDLENLVGAINRVLEPVKGSADWTTQWLSDDPSQGPLVHTMMQLTINFHCSDAEHVCLKDYLSQLRTRFSWPRDWRARFSVDIEG